MSGAQVFVSYSWKMEKETKVVNEIEGLCSQRNIQLVRDEDAMQHGDLIMDFMDDLTSGDHIITVLSKPYFQSKWCMYELLKIWQKGDYNQRTHSIIIDSCDLQDTEYRIDIVRGWGDKYEEVTRLLEGVPPTLVAKEHEQAKIIRDIYQNANDLMNFAAGRMTTPLVNLQTQRYAQILDQIQEIQPTYAESTYSSKSKKQRASRVEITDKLHLVQQEIVDYNHVHLGKNTSQAIDSALRYHFYLKSLALGDEQHIKKAAQILSSFYYAASGDHNFKHFREFLILYQTQFDTPQEHLNPELYLG